ncbi:TOMM precursor leader peptide-binding protein [Streptomyces apocyni]|uniref:TOMM precursor leader peptide-binding protein n=1 Tax=Streptomyces apocyni TaxID=2654677 RepID=UPI002D802D43|nr:TOMM precursor leader peptide-binding protein [Streptomyces apocyni]
MGFKRHLRVEVVAGDAVYVLSPHGVKVLHGDQIEALAPLLDGTRTLPALLREAAVPAVTAGRVLRQLAEAGLIGYHVTAPDSETDLASLAYWDLLGVDASAATRSLADKQVQVITVGDVDASLTRRACQESGLTVSDQGADDETCALSLVLCDDYLAAELRAVDAWHRAERRPWLLAAPGGPTPWVGPVFVPDDGPCWTCLTHRIRAQRHAELPAQRALGISGPMACPAASLAAGRAIGVQMAVLETAKWLAGAYSDLHEGLFTLDTRTLAVRAHPVRRRPQCPECGDVRLMASRGWQPVAINSRPKASWEGSHRAIAPEDLLARYRHLVSPVTGIVSDVKRDDRLPNGLNCYVSGRNLALNGHSLDALRGGLRSCSAGKGVTSTEAETGALCEGVERYCATRQGDEPVVYDSLRGLGDRAIHPNACQLFDERQFRDREHWNARNSAFQQVCAPFPEDRPTDWTPVWSLTEHAHKLLPTSMLYFCRDIGSSANGPWADSNGNAAGSSIEDAVVQGFLELVERDAVALWWYNRTRQPAIDMDAFDEPWLAATREAYARVNRTLWVLDLTADLGIPAMAAISRRHDKPTEDITLGFGAHFDPRIALRRAVTEMTQSLPAVLHAAFNNTGYALSDPELMSWWTTATTQNQPYLVPDPGLTARTPSTYGYSPQPDLKEDVRTCESLARGHGMELLVLDQTRPDVELPVVKVIVPGLRHFWARFAPGRLFDVPVTLGRVEKSRQYADLNPIPLFL